MELERVVRPGNGKTILVLLHGLAADEHDLVDLAQYLDPSLFVVSLRAPHETGYGGYSWFDIRFFEDGSKEIDEAQAIASRDSLIAAIEGLPSELGVNESKVVLGGFSQGAMMSAGVLIARPDLLVGAWLMSGAYLPCFDSKVKSPASLPVLVQHGESDPVVAFTGGELLAKTISGYGHRVSFAGYPMGHQIGLDSLNDARKWMSPILDRFE